MKNFLLLTLLLAIIPHSYALTLEDALHHVASKNLQILASQQSIEEAVQDALIARSALFPQINASAAQSRSRFFANFGTTSFSGHSNRYDALLNGSISIIDLRKITDWRLARMGKKIAQANSNALKEEILNQTATAYLSHLRNTERLAVIDANIKRDASLLDIAKTLMDAGAAAAIDVTRAEVQLEIDKKERLQAETALTQSALNLALLLDQDPATDFNLQPVKTPRAPLFFKDDFQKSICTRPDYLAATESLHQANSRYRSSYVDHLPSLNAEGNYGRSSLVAFDENESRTWSAGASISLPIFEGFRVRANTAKYKAQARSQRYALRDLENKVRSEIAFNQQDLKSRFQQIKITQKQQTLAEQELDLARSRFQEGVADNQEVIEAQANLTQFSDEHIEAQYQYHLAILEWARVHGNVLDVLNYV